MGKFRLLTLRDMQNPFDKERVAKNYNNWYIENTKIDELEKRLILKLIKPNFGETLLDIGCGAGWHLHWFKNLGLEVKGIDISPYMVKEAREFLGDKVDIQVMPAENLEFADNSFDIVTLITVLEFVEDPLKVLKEALRVSKNRVFLGVLNKYSWLNLRRKYLSLFKESVYKKAKFYTVRELVNLVKSIHKDLNIHWQTAISHQPSKNYWGAFIGVLIT